MHDRLLPNLTSRAIVDDAEDLLKRMNDGELDHFFRIRVCCANRHAKCGELANKRSRRFGIGRNEPSRINLNGRIGSRRW